jgi:hypothetical protein
MMRFPKTAERASSHGQPWPRVVGALALAVLAACGVIVLVIPGRADSPTSLESRSNWVLAGALPASIDFPGDWGYSVTGPLQRTRAWDTVSSSTPQTGVPRAVYAPAGCANIPKILDHSGARFGPSVGVDRYTELNVHPAAFIDSDATGELDEQGPRASLAIWVVPKGPARIANYVDWLGRCGSYHVTNYDGDGKFKSQRNVQTAVEGRSADGPEASVTVTRTFIPVGNRKAAATYQVSYYAVRGVILECSIYKMDGPDRSLMQRRAAETLRRLRAL